MSVKVKLTVVQRLIFINYVEKSAKNEFTREEEINSEAKEEYPDDDSDENGVKNETKNSKKKQKSINLANAMLSNLGNHMVPQSSKYITKNLINSIIKKKIEPRYSHGKYTRRSEQK